jgi:trans-aconitate methyltransferase
MPNANKVAKEWELMGKKDPKWGALTTPGKEQKWGDQDFLQTGEREISDVLNWLSVNGSQVIDKRNALDFGCGPGRLTLALSKEFSKVTGLDVSPSMLEEARRLTRNEHDKCEFLQSKPDSIDVIGERRFGFIYSNHVLQHIPTSTAKKIIQQLCGALEDNGLLVFRVPHRRRLTLGKIVDFLSPAVLQDFIYKLRFGDRPRMRMHAIPVKKVEKLISQCNCQLELKSFSNGSERWQTCLYAVRKK